MTRDACFTLCTSEYYRAVMPANRGETSLLHIPDPVLMLALCQQESNFNESEARLENGFYRRYTRPLALSPTSEVLLATSWGLTQVMGENLAVLGYVNRQAIACARSIEEYMQRPELHVRAAMQFLQDKLREVSTSSWRAALVRYNGRDSYADEVIGKYRELRKELKNPYGPHVII